MDRRAKKSPKDPGGHEWRKLPKGWTDESRKKFWDTLTARAPKHKVTQCIKKMDGKVSDPGAFCAALADRVIPGWREEAAKERRKKKALEHLSRAASTLKQPLRTRRDYGALSPDVEDEKHSVLPGADTLSLGDQEKDEPNRLASSDWITREEMATLCPPCAERMKKARVARVRASVVRRMLLEG